MFKFVVLCALVAAAVGEPKPDVLIDSPYVYPGGLVPSVPAYYPSAYSNYVYPSAAIAAGPLAYSAPLTHLIKKRSVGYISPAPLVTGYAAAPISTYPALSPLATTYSTYPGWSTPIYTAGAHLIKKRSAPILPSTYSYPASAPLAGWGYPAYPGAASYIPSPVLPSYPLAYSPFIKK